jgi:hypothetical protein
MQVRVYYSQQMLEATVKYITEHNLWFYDKPVVVRVNIMTCIQDLVDQFPKTIQVGRDGFFVGMTDFELEGIDQDENVMNVEFLVDPTIGTVSANEKYISEIFLKRTS